MSRKKFLTLKEACEWGSSYLGRKVTPSNISYLIQYAKILRYNEKDKIKTSSNGTTKVSLNELKQYYNSAIKEKVWKGQIGEDINWSLSFDNVNESERTKHVHRLHPYKGKFIPQLVEYFLNNNTNKFKKAAFFREGDIILDPFAGSGTTLIQCLELGLHSIGIDISKFNCMISKAKIQKYNLDELAKELHRAVKATEKFSKTRFRYEPENNNAKLCSSFNEKYYPNPEFKILIGHIYEEQKKLDDKINTLGNGDYKNRQEIIEKVLNDYKDEIFILETEIANFLDRNSVPIQFKINSNNVENLVNKFADKYGEIVLKELDEKINSLNKKEVKLSAPSVEAFADSPFLSTWFTERKREEMKVYLDQINSQDDIKIRTLMKIILSRTARSCRATKHVDLATLVKPQSKPYYCRKHFKICRPVTTIIPHLRRYTEDTIKRISEFSQLRKDVFCEIINDDSRTIDLFEYIAKKNEGIYRILEKKKIDGIFTSPPYIGQIDYHEQHAYAYELFNINRKDNLEIGKKSNGSGRKAQSEYITGISAVLFNVKKYLKENSHIFIVANDSKNLYPKIAKASGLEIVKVYRRPVLDRTERDKQPYSESIFHMIFK